MSKTDNPKHRAKSLNRSEVVDLLRRISDGATGNTVPLSEVLRLCIRLGRLLGNEELVTWAKAEVMGYEDTKTMPNYRTLDTEVHADFYGPFGSGIKNTIIPRSFIEKKHRDTLCKSYMTQPVAELEHLTTAPSKGGGTLTAHWSGDAIAYYQQKELYTNGMVIASAWRVLTQSAVAGILETIRTRVLDFALRIEDELGLDGAQPAQNGEIEQPTAKKVEQIVYATIYGAGNVSLGNNGNLTQSIVNVQPGDLNSLKAYLKESGLPDELINDLEGALDKDSNADLQPGPATQSWLGKVMILLGKGTLSLSSNISGSLVAEAIMRFLGLAQ
jgi:hypothetical protein